MYAYCRNSPVCRIDILGTYDVECGVENPLNDEDLNNDSGYGGAQEAGRGFSSFQALKNYLGSAGEKMHWHHIVEQSQINKSGFSSEQVHNTSNVIAVDAHTHAQITGYYNTTTFRFTKGLSVRNWLSGQSFQAQFDFGMGVLRDFGVIQ